MRVLVTGGAGFIGSHLADRLVADGHDVRVLDNLVAGREANLATVRADVDLVVGDVRDREAVARAVRSVEVVYHQAALVSVARSVGAPEETFENNVAGTVQLLAACRAAGVRRIVFASSSSVYGEGDTGPRVESQSLRPASPYAASKAAGEAWVQACRAAYDLETVVLRYFNVYGPRQDAGSAYAAAVPRFVDDALAGRPFRIDGDGRQTRDFTFVADVVEANVRVGASSAVVGGVFNVGTGRARAIEDLARAVADGAGVRAELRRGPPRPGDVRASQACVDALEAALAWRPAVGLREGLARVIDAARARRGVPLAER